MLVYVRTYVRMSVLLILPVLDVFSGTYRGMNVAIKVMKEGQTETNVASEFSREAAILT